ncbi:helix-turn-helix transcriptional regulator [Actinacidiphila rubida]|nr:LuxR C-terminal-related transcriptional regulator [Actinacidiphila rubida]
MQTEAWSTPQDALDRTLQVLGAPLSETMARLSEVLAPLVPHAAVARLSGVCAFTPAQSAGDGEVAGRISAAELGGLAGQVPIGRPWQGGARMAGVLRPVLAVSSAPEGVEAAPGGTGTLLVVVRDGASPEPVPDDVARIVQRLWDLVTAHTARRTAEADPGQAASTRAAAGARARVIAELTDAHSSALTSVLGTLRARALDDATARRAAADLAVAALARLRAGADLDRELTEEPADAAFARLADELRPLLRHSPVELDLRGPGSRRSLPVTPAHGARTAVRAAVLAMLEQGDALRRLHVSWQVGDDELRAVVRDDGPGLLAAEALAGHRIAERLAAVDGRLLVDALPGWGTTVTVTLPLRAPDVPAARQDPLDALHPREREVLGELALGRRNREIARTLHISESTVKFHVANILAKLGAGSRGEAAALAHRAGLVPAPAVPAPAVRAVTG